MVWPHRKHGLWILRLMNDHADAQSNFQKHNHCSVGQIFSFRHKMLWLIFRQPNMTFKWSCDRKWPCMELFKINVRGYFPDGVGVWRKHVVKNSDKPKWSWSKNLYERIMYHAYAGTLLNFLKTYTFFFFLVRTRSIFVDTHLNVESPSAEPARPRENTEKGQRGPGTHRRTTIRDRSWKGASIRTLWSCRMVPYSCSMGLLTRTSLVYRAKYL